MHRLCTVLLTCCAMSWLCLNSQLVHAQDEKRVQEKKRVDRKEARERESVGDFYRVIVENNLFRPLGWRRPNRDPEYALVATWIGTQGTVAKALVMERKSSQLYYVARGEKVGDAIVENIAANQVSLKGSDDIVTLKAESMQFLSGSSRSRDKSGEGEGDAASEERPNDERREQRAARRGANRERDALREWLRNASPEERRRKLEAIRRERGGGGRRGGRARNNDGGDKDEVDWDEIKGK
ncbi:hypothetical protein C6502_18025 [Candidatus Poribacteria bacterium]|nr:MAG: hypothetical protein C6502_18025 [Candidatus Poribacteria bacterium]